MPKSREINTKRLYFTGRLMEAMNGILDYPLTIVEAPMGYGKTTAVREYLSRAGISPLWLRVYTPDSAVFWTGFARLIGSLDGDCSKSLLALGFPHDAVTAAEALRLLAGLELSESAVLVIDDYHLLDSAELNTFFELLAEEETRGLHIVLNTRYVKLKRLEELSLKRRLRHIAKEAFELAPAEISEYYNACGIRLSAEQAEALYGLTEGWISALYLFLLEYSARGGFTNTGSIFRLLETAVYAPMREECKNFLLSVCLFDSFTLQQAEYIWGASARGILSELADNNSFVTRESRAGAYSIHSIFTDFLREELCKRSSGFQMEIFRKAAEWYRKARDFSAAREYCFLSGDFDGLFTALEEDAAIDYSAYDKDLFIKYMAACPEVVKARHPLAMLKFALSLFVHNETALFGQVCAKLRGIAENSETLDAGLRNSLLGGLELLMSLAAFNDLEQMALHQKKAWELLGRPAEIFSPKTQWNFGSPSVLYLYYRESGKLREHAAALIEDLPLYNRLTSGHGAGGGYVMEAERCFNAGDFDDAEISLQEAELTAKAADESNILLCCAFLRARLDLLRVDGVSLFGRLKGMRETMTDRKLYVCLYAVELCEGFVYAWLGRKDCLPDRLLEADPKTPRLGFPAFGMFYMLLGSTYLLRGEYLKLLGSGGHWLQTASVFPNLLGIIYTNIFLAAANNRISRREDALCCLRKALDMALPDELYMPFTENCDYIQPLLWELSGCAAYREGISKILALSEVFRAGKELILAELPPEKPVLSEREMEIARLASEGLSNREIGERLYISENTVKSALKSVFAKLSVSSRMGLKNALTAREK